ncbi:MAG: hypothetical protein ACPL7I_00660, partial [Myxococcota bacterium]
MINAIFLILISINGDFTIKERLNLSLEYDSNVYRRPSNTGENIISDSDIKLQSDLSLKYLRDRHLYKANILNGGKLFFNESDANTVVTMIDTSYLFKISRFSPEIGIELKDITTVKTAQDYSLIKPYISFNYFSDLFFIKLIGDYEKFIFDVNNDYSYNAAAAGLVTAYQIDENLNLNLNYLFRYIVYDSYAYRRLGNLDQDSILTTRTEKSRQDINHNLIIRLNYESDILLSISYNPEINSSNSVGESVFRQRLQLSMTSMLFFKIYLNMLLSFMISSFKDGILISDQLLLINDNENRNYIIIKLSRDISRKL